MNTNQHESACCQLCRGEDGNCLDFPTCRCHTKTAPSDAERTGDKGRIKEAVIETGKQFGFDEIKKDVMKEFEKAFMERKPEGIYITGAFTAPRILMFIKTAIDQAYKQGKGDGMAEEAIGCHEHCEKARADERERIVKIAKSLILPAHMVVHSTECVECKEIAAYNESLTSLIKAITNKDKK